MQGGGFRPAIHRGDSNEHVFDVRFRVLHENIKVAIAGKCSGIEQFEFRRRALAPAIFFHESFIGKFGLRIFVKHAHIAVRGS